MNKAYLLLTLLPFASIRTTAQGTISFSNADIPNAAGTGAYNARLVPVGLDPTPPVSVIDSTFTAGLFINNIMITSTPMIGETGYFLGDEGIVPNSAPGSRPMLEVRVWKTSAGSYDAAVTANAMRGQSDPFQSAPLGGPNPTPPPPAIFTPGLTGFGDPTTQLGWIQMVPEPSTYAMAFLGLAGLATFRNRKS